MQYCYLIAGLPDITLEDNKLALSLIDFKKELKQQLSSKDYARIAWFFKEFDNENLWHYLHDKEAEFNPLGVLSKQDFDELILLVRENENPKDKRLHSYMQKFLMIWEETENKEEITKEYLYSLFYDEALSCNNTFIKKWHEFNLNITNIFTALNCRKHKLPIENYVVGNNEVAKLIAQNSGKDFGIQVEFPEIDELISIAETKNLLEREQKIDLLKWQWLEEHAFFYYFTVEFIWKYLIQLQIISRKSLLITEEGKARFEKMINDMKSSAIHSEDYTN